jgi:hypothetical protein
MINNLDEKSRLHALLVQAMLKNKIWPMRPESLMLMISTGVRVMISSTPASMLLAEFDKFFF